VTTAAISPVAKEAAAVELSVAERPTFDRVGMR
jgi:hypothetical protein